MTEQKQAKKVELTAQQKLENLLYSLGNLAAMIGAIRWYCGLCWHTRRAHNRYAGPPVCIELFGTNPTDAQDILRDYGIRGAYGSLQWAVVENKIALRFLLLVSQASFDYADCILDAYQGQTFDILSNAGRKRGQTLRRPYAQRNPAKHINADKTPTKRQTPPARQPAKLGKPYQRTSTK